MTPRRSSQLRYRDALITGGSRGIGLAFAERLAAEGTSVTLVARDKARLDTVAADLRRRSSAVIETIAVNLATPEGQHTVARHLETSRTLDLLVNNVGGGAVAPFVQRPADGLDAEIALNVATTVRLTRAALPGMLDRRAGAIVNVAAGTAFYPTPMSAVYGAAKAFVVSFTEAVRQELRGTGVSVTAVAPGFTRTDAQASGGIDAGKVPSWLWADPDRVAAAALRGAAGRAAIVYPDRSNRLSAALTRRVPRRVLLPAIAATQSWLALPAGPLTAG